MENVYKINSSIPPSAPLSPRSPEEKHIIIYAVLILAIAFIGIVFYVMYNNAPEPEIVKEERVIYTHEQKLEILNELAGNPENIPPIEERRAILNKISESKPADAREYSQEEKLNILYSIQ